MNLYNLVLRLAEFNENICKPKNNLFKKEFYEKPRTVFFSTASYLQWIGGVEDIEAEFDSIDANGGGQILFSEFVDWALSKVFNSFSF